MDGGCQDYPGYDCEKIKDVVCFDKDLIEKCRKTCGKCSKNYLAIIIHQPFLRTFLVSFTGFFFLYLEAFESNTTSGQNYCYCQIYKAWRKMQRMFLQMVDEYGPKSHKFVFLNTSSNLGV